MHCGQMQKEQIAAGMLQGEPQAEIAKRIGMDQSTVSRASRSAEVSALVEAGFKELSGSWSKAVSNIKTVVNEYNDPINSNVPLKLQLMRREHGFKASERLVEGMGLLPSNSQPQYITNLMQVNNYISPIVDKILDSMIMGAIDNEVDK